MSWLILTAATAARDVGSRLLTAPASARCSSRVHRHRLLHERTCASTTAAAAVARRPQQPCPPVDSSPPPDRHRRPCLLLRRHRQTSPTASAAASFPPPHRCYAVLHVGRNNCHPARHNHHQQQQQHQQRRGYVSAASSGRASSLLPTRDPDADPSRPAKTFLYDFHVAHGGKMVEFAGFMMPLQYGGMGIAESHRHTRSHCSLFDVSHMVQTRVTGRDRVKFMESLTVADLEELDEGSGTLTVFTNERGGVIDDLICSKAQEGEALYVVSNAGRRDRDLRLLETQLDRFREENLGEVEVTVLDKDYGLMALQGPEAAAVLQPLTTVDLTELKFMRNCIGEVAGVAGCRVTRCGYTGEDGVEISVPRPHCASVAAALLASRDGDVQLAGLGARDSLRVEAGLCLYGAELDEDTTPVEATLAWTVGRRRRRDADFPGADVVLGQLSKRTPPQRRRVGLANTPLAGGGAARPFRAGSEILSEGDGGGGTVVGRVTSGVPSPSLPGRNVGMGYVVPDLVKPGTRVRIRVGKAEVAAQVVKMPFVPTRYYV